MFVYRKIFYGVFITTFRTYMSKRSGLTQFSAYAGLTQRRAMKRLYVINQSTPNKTNNMYRRDNV